MAEWITPVTDRTVADTTAARREQSNAENNKGALNYQDLNRIEGNYRYLLEKLESDSFFIPHRYRNYEETTIEKTEVQPDLGYTPVEYIESSGTQWIDTGFAPNQDSGFVIDADILDSNKSGTFHISTMNDASTYYALRINEGFTGFQIRYASEELKTATHKGNLYGRHIFSRSKNTFNIDGQNPVISTYAAFQQSKTLPLFCFKNASGVVSNFTNMRLYSCKIYDNDVLIRDYIPVKDPSGVACLYDKVSKSFYRNAGTGEFTAGAEIPVAPTTEYAEVKRTYTDWQERNIPWLSEIDRIRANYNALVRLFLIGLGLPLSSESNYLAYQEVNDWERIALTGKEMFENMAQEYIPCGTMDSGGDSLL